MSDTLDSLLALAASLQQKGNLTQSDVNPLFSPELGYLTGTFYGGDTAAQSAQDDELLWMDYAPNFKAALGLPDTDIRKIIANEIYSGANPWDLKRQIEEYTAKQAELYPGVINQEGETKDLQSFANTAFSEWNNYRVAKTKQQRQGADDTLSKGGVPDPSLDFAPEQIAPELFELLAGQNTALQAEGGKLSQRSKSRSAALKYIQQQQAAAQKRTEQAAAKRAPFPSDVDAESIPEALRRNLANTPMGRGEAGLMGLIPLYKMLEQVPAGAAAVYRGITDPLYDEAIRNVNYIGQETIGRQLPKVSLGPDPVGAILYGKNRKQQSRSGNVDANDAAESARFGRIAEGVVERSAGVEADVAENKRRAQWMNDLTSILGTLAQAKARSVGYTPFQETMTARSNFLRGGG